ncbi:helix-turn-helix domain-containing protein [Nocardioides sp. LHG3406-4]|uniref:helix-turn-helix domain-containing protein n=1 Tax=Nocardioides sp. LHG3406-4 TaxID=2804575 RepID=UPI003CEEF836
MPDMKQIARDAAFWPSIQEVADDYRLPFRTVRRLVTEGEVEAIKLGKIRVNPASVERWLGRQYQPGEG